MGATSVAKTTVDPTLAVRLTVPLFVARVQSRRDRAPRFPRLPPQTCLRHEQPILAGKPLQQPTLLTWPNTISLAGRLPTVENTGRHSGTHTVPRTGCPTGSHSYPLSGATRLMSQMGVVRAAVCGGARPRPAGLLAGASGTSAETRLRGGGSWASLRSCAPARPSMTAASNERARASPPFPRASVCGGAWRMTCVLAC